VREDKKVIFMSPIASEFPSCILRGMILGVVFDAAVGFIVGLPLLYMIGRNVPSYSSAPDVAMSVSEHMETGKQLHSSFQPRYL
jgi:hypothetical protein